jgi:hypothetical protein
MFAWLKQQLAQRAAKKRYAQHFASAEGPDFHRSIIAAGMHEVEDGVVAKVRKRMSPNHESNFMMAYECVVSWALKTGIESVLGQEGAGPAIAALHRYFEKHAWYRPGAFEKVWEEIQFAMPQAMQPGPDGTPPYPLAEMVIAANEAGYPCDVTAIGLTFGFHVLQTMHALFSVGQFSAKTFGKAEGSGPTASN